MVEEVYAWVMGYKLGLKAPECCDMHKRYITCKRSSSISRRTETVTERYRRKDRKKKEGRVRRQKD